MMDVLKKEVKRLLKFEIEFDGNSDWIVFHQITGNHFFYTIVKKKDFDSCNGDAEAILKLDSPFMIVSQEYYDYYKREEFRKFKGKSYLTFEQAIQAIQTKQYHLILSSDDVYDDGFFYDFNGNLVFRNIIIDDSFVHVRTGIKPVFDKALAKAEKHPKVKSLELVPVSYYNLDPGDLGKSFTFIYQPTEKEFREFVKKTSRKIKTNKNSIVKIRLSLDDIKEIVWNKVFGKNFVDRYKYEKKYPDKYKELVGKLEENIW